MNPTKAINFALAEHKRINSTPGQWAALEMIRFEDDSYVIRLDRGVRHTNGFKESTLRSTCYTLDKDGLVRTY